MYKLVRAVERNKFTTTAIGIKGRSGPTLQHARARDVIERCALLMVDAADGSDSVGHTLSPGCGRAGRGLRSARRRPAGYRRPAIPVIGRPPPDLDRAEAGLGAIVPADHARQPLQPQTRLGVDLRRRPDDHRVGRPFQGFGKRDIEVKVDQAHPADSRFCPEGREPTDRAGQGWERRLLQDIGDLRRRTGRAAEVVQRPTVVRPLVIACVRPEPLVSGTRRRLFRLDTASAPSARTLSRGAQKMGMCGIASKRISMTARTRNGWASQDIDTTRAVGRARAIEPIRASGCARYLCWTGCTVR